MNLGIPVRVDPEIQQNSQDETCQIQLVGGLFSRTPPQKSIYIGCISMFNFECEQLFGVFVDSSPKETPAIRHRHVWEVPFVQTRTKKAAAWGFFWGWKSWKKSPWSICGHQKNRGERMENPKIHRFSPWHKCQILR